LSGCYGKAKALEAGLEPSDVAAVLTRIIELLEADS
jgi:hypothetical protein